MLLALLTASALLAAPAAAEKKQAVDASDQARVQKAARQARRYMETGKDEAAFFDTL